MYVFFFSLDTNLKILGEGDKEGKWPWRTGKMVNIDICH